MNSFWGLWINFSSKVALHTAELGREWCYTAACLVLLAWKGLGLSGWAAWRKMLPNSWQVCSSCDEEGSQKWKMSKPTYGFTRLEAPGSFSPSSWKQQLLVLAVGPVLLMCFLQPADNVLFSKQEPDKSCCSFRQRWATKTWSLWLGS